MPQTPRMLLRTDRLSGTGRSADGRSDFQRDRDRVLYSAHFRRLGGVTQVTSPAELYSFHNRLTHTLEVAQISRRIAEQFLRRDPSLEDELDPDVCESAALIHDLGHPPFGHNGEKTLDKVALELATHDDAPDNSGYEGNAQSLRIVCKLAIRAAGGRGLDLTTATLRASIKYPWFRAADGPHFAKFGVFRTEEDEFNRLFEGIPPAQTLEAQIMDWADDVAYSVHDLYDFILAGLIPLDRLVNASGPDLKQLLKTNAKVADIHDDIYQSVADGLTLLPAPSLGNTSRFNSQLVGDLKTWVSTLINRYASQQISITGDAGSRQLTKEPQIEDEVSILKALTYHYAIGSPSLALRQSGERAILKGLFQILHDDALTEQRMMSLEAQARLAHEGNPIRTVLDTISSMTDAQAASIYYKLTGVSLSSVLDLTTPSLF